MSGAPATLPHEQPAVVLVHGLWMTGWDMLLLARRLKRCGFRVYRFHYRSTHHGLRESAFRLSRFLETVPEETVHFVGHSLGGLVIRRLFLDYPRQRPGRVVTLGTPHRTSRSASRMREGALGRWALGKSLRALTEELPPWEAQRDLGSIAGSVPFGMGRLLRCLPDANDGTVALDETFLPGSRAHRVLPVSHMGMLVAEAVARESCLFLQTGRFSATPTSVATTGETS